MRLNHSLFFSSFILFLSSVVAGDALQKWTHVALKSKWNVIKLNHNTFDEIISGERNYSTIGISSSSRLYLIVFKQLFLQHWLHSINVRCVENLILSSA